MEIKSFDSMEEMFEELDNQRKAADDRVEPWQRKLRPGDYAVRWFEGITIYSEILRPSSEDRALYKQPHMKHFRLTRSYSVVCPEGEIGDVHVSTFHHLCDAKQWERAVEKGFPSEMQDVYYVVRGEYPPHSC